MHQSGFEGEEALVCGVRVVRKALGKGASQEGVKALGVISEMEEEHRLRHLLIDGILGIPGWLQTPMQPMS